MHGKWWRSGLLAGSLLFIAVATLTPGAVGGSLPLRPDFWCLACGSEAGADVSLNIALFLPLGAALALLRVPPLRAFAVGALLSIGVETAQRLGVPPGRVASITDLLTNSSGTLIGAFIAWNHQHWLRPSPRAAKVLSIASLIVAATFLGFTGWALGRDSQLPVADGHAGLQQRRGAFAADYGWYQGTVSSVTVGSEHFTHDGNGPFILFGGTGRELRGSVEMDGRDERQEFVPFLSIESTQSLVPELLLGQHNGNAQLRVRLRGSQLRLPGPSLVLPHAFVAPGAVHRTVTFHASPKLLTLSSTTGTDTSGAKLAVSLSLGWTLFQTVVHLGDRLAVVVTLLWLFVLWLPVGYWCALAGVSSSTRVRRFGIFGHGSFVAAGVVSLLLTLWLVPRATGIAATLPLEWMLSAFGLSVGVFLAARFYHYIPPQ